MYDSAYRSETQANQLRSNQWTGNPTYNKDFNLWAKHTAKLLRQHCWQEIDIAHVAEEIEDLGKSERRGVVSQLIRLLTHLLKWEYQPEKRTDSWLDSIADARLQIELTLQDSPSLQTYPAEQLISSYAKARRTAARQTGLALSIFPDACPFALDNILSEDWLPE